MGFYYLVLLTYSLFDQELNWIPFVRIGVLNIYPVDFLYLAVVVFFVKGLIQKRYHLAGWDSRVYLGFLLWLSISIVRGFFIYGYPALGESRNVLGFFAFALPFSMIDSTRTRDPEYLSQLVRNTILFVAYGAMIAFVVGALRSLAGMNIGDASTERGERLVDGNHTFYLVLVSCYFLLKRGENLRLGRRDGTLLLVAVIMAVVSKNRSPFVALGTVMVIVFGTKGKLGLLLRFLVIALVSVAIILILFPTLSQQVEYAFGGLLNPEEDETGYWRLIIQGAAFDQALGTFWLGQGYGGYFSFVVPGSNYNLPMEFPPHNQFLALFLKTGIIGVVLCILLLAVFTAKSAAALRHPGLTPDRRVTVLSLLLVFASHFLYGLAYDFFPLFGLMCGFAVIFLSALDGGTRQLAMTSPEAPTKEKS